MSFNSVFHTDITFAADWDFIKLNTMNQPTRLDWIVRERQSWCGLSLSE